MTITKQRVIMHRSSIRAKGGVTFREDMDEPGIQRGITVSFEDWIDMDSPGVITVTIEPGDLLNDDPIIR